MAEIILISMMEAFRYEKKSAEKQAIQMVEQDVLPPHRERQKASFRSRLLLRLSCAALALLLAIGAAPLLRHSFNVPLPVVYGVGTESNPENIEIRAVIDPDWDSDTEMDGYSIWYSKKIRIETGKNMYLREGKTIHMMNNQSSTGNSDNSGIYINGNAELHVYGKITGEFDEISKQFSYGNAE